MEGIIICLDVCGEDHSYLIIDKLLLGSIWEGTLWKVNCEFILKVESKHDIGIVFSEHDLWFRESEFQFQRLI